MTGAEVRVIGLLALNIEGSHGPRNVGSLLDLEKARKWIFPLELLEGMEPY